MEKKYLKWYNKIGYGSGDIAGNVVYALLSSFVMIYLTNTVGLEPGIVGTIMAVSKIFDGITDIFFGSMIDKTKSKIGKARPWMLWGYVGCSAMIIAIFAIPVSLGEFAKYAWFFIAYTALNAVFYTANNIAYSSLTSLVTKNKSERVQLGSIRFMFAFATSMLIQYITVDVVEMCGGGAEGWRTMAIIYAIIGLIVNTISVLTVKELPEEELENETAQNKPKEKYTLAQSFKLLLANKYYIIICGVYIFSQIFTAMLNMGIYFMTYILGDASLLGVFSVATNIPLIIGLVIVAGYMGNLPLMLLFTGIASLGMSPLQGDLNALIAECSEYTYLTQKKRIDGTMFSCTSLGVKIGGGIGTAIGGWLLQFGGFVRDAAVQPDSCINMIYFMYLWLPMILNLIITILLSTLRVEQENSKLR